MSSSVEILYRVFLVLEFLLWFFLLINAASIGISVYRLRKPLLKNNEILNQKRRNRNPNTILDDSNNSDMGPIAKNRSRRRNGGFSSHLENLGPELFNWTAMCFTALFRSVYFLALVIIPYHTSLSVNCIEIGYCPDQANDSNLASINFWLNFLNDLFYPFFLMVSGGIIILWFKMLWRVQKIKYHECAIRIILLFLVIILVFFTITIILDLLYKGDMTNSSDSLQTSAIGAELIVFALGFLVQTLGFTIFGFKFWNQFYHHQLQNAKFSQTYTQILNKVVICIGGLFSVGILLLIIPLPALSGKSPDSNVSKVMQVLYSVVLKLIELALAIHLQYLLYVSLIEKSDSKIFSFQSRYLWATTGGGNSFSNFVLNNDNQDNRTSIHAQLHPYEPLDDDDDLEDPDYLLDNEEDETGLFDVGKGDEYVNFHNTAINSEEDSQHTNENGNGITYSIDDSYYNQGRKATEGSDSGSIVHIVSVTADE